MNALNYFETFISRFDDDMQSQATINTFEMFLKQIKERVLRVQKHQVRHRNIQTAPQVHKEKKSLEIHNENMAKSNLESLKKAKKKSIIKKSKGMRKLRLRKNFCELKSNGN